MKKLFIVLISLLLSFSLFAHEGSMAGAGKLRFTQTKYFDLIYGEKNLASANILYEKADAVFEELAAAYGVEPSFRIPVVITATVEQFNAYYANSPYNRIVLYDTGQIDDLAVFSETLLSTFTHELTHALTYNLKNKTFKVIGKIFGDAISNHYFTVTSGIAEGATVSYESSKGEGRLNDPYSLQMIRQAKIEGQFPTYSDVKGASDAYPKGSFYYFNGAFAEFLQRNFGMHKYSEFWYRCINGEEFSDLTTAGAFKKTFGIKLNRAWKMFENSLQVPSVAGANPLAAGQAFDFFDKQNQSGDFSLKNTTGSRFSNLRVCETGLAYVDDSNNTIYFVQNGKNPQKLFHQDYLDGIRLSLDGRFLTISHYSTASATIKHCAKIYDFETKKLISVPGTNYVSPTVISSNGEYYFLAQKYEKQRYSIVIQKLDVENKLALCENPLEFTFDAEQVPTEFTDLGNGLFAFSLKSGLDYSICVSDFNFSNITEYPLPYEKMKIRDLSLSSNTLYFSWATKETLPRLGMLNLEDGQFSLMNENISGGVYTPVQKNGHIYYTAQFYKQSRLLELSDGWWTCDEIAAIAAHSPIENSSVPLPQPLPYKNYSPFQYAFNGFLIPIGGIASNVPTLGLTYMNSSPWYSGVTMISGGYDISSKCGIFDFSYQSGTDTNLLQYSLISTLKIHESGFKELGGSVSISSGFDFGRRYAVLFAARENARYGKLSDKNDNTSFSSLEIYSASWTNVFTCGPGTYERKGITLTTGLAHSYETDLEPYKNKICNIYDVEFDADVYIPKLLPILCIDNFTYNLPTKVNTSLFSLSASDYRLIKVNTETVLFGYDIQKAIPGFSAIFVNDVILTISYTGGFDYINATEAAQNWHLTNADTYLDQIKSGDLTYKQYAKLKLSLGFTPNIGTYANSAYRNNVYLSFAFGPKQHLPEKLFNFGFEGKF
jgi:hypothetical protein